MLPTDINNLLLVMTMSSSNSMSVAKTRVIEGLELTVIEGLELTLNKLRTNGTFEKYKGKLVAKNYT